MALQEKPTRIKLPPLPATKPDQCIHPTLCYYHLKPSIIHRCIHYLYPAVKYVNQRYVIPTLYSPWTGAEDSLLLQHIPHTEPGGIGASLGYGQTISWSDIASRMTDWAYKLDITRRVFTGEVCRERYNVILYQYENNGMGVAEGHRGVNPYTTLIRVGDPCTLRTYRGLEDELAGKKFYRGKRAIISGQGRDRLPGIRAIGGIGKGVMKRRELPRNRLGLRTPTPEFDEMDWCW